LAPGRHMASPRSGGPSLSARLPGLFLPAGCRPPPPRERRIHHQLVQRDRPAVLRGRAPRRFSCVGSMINMMSVDVEDWFQVHNLTRVISYRQWDLLELRVKTNTTRILQLLDKHHTKATFFVLGWLAERLPQLVRDVAGE